MTKKIIPRTLKGFRDFLPSEIFKREFLKKNITEVFELYGFEPIETPALEYLETFAGNIGEEEKLFYNFTDQGGREVALRYDQTVPTCRLVAQHTDKIQLPFKRYQIQTVWRAEKPQKGRYREFLQCDADIFGVAEAEADAEVMALSLNIYQKLGFKEYILKVNDRSLFADIPYKVIVAIDKLAKIGRDGVIEEIIKKGYSRSEAEDYLKQIDKIQPNQTIKTIFKYLENLGVTKDKYTFDPSLARSFSYSTGPIWEVIIPGFTAGSVLGGERFDQLISRFQKNEVPATGFGLGFDRTVEAMEQFNLFPDLKTKTTALVTVFSSKLLEQSLGIIKTLRDNQINSELYSNLKDRLDKQFKYADKKNIPYVLIIGEDEIKKDKVRLKEMASGKQKLLTKTELIQFFKEQQK